MILRCGVMVFLDSKKGDDSTVNLIIELEIENAQFYLPLPIKHLTSIEKEIKSVIKSDSDYKGYRITDLKVVSILPISDKGEVVLDSSEPATKSCIN